MSVDFPLPGFPVIQRLFSSGEQSQVFTGFLVSDIELSRDGNNEDRVISASVFVIWSSMTTDARRVLRIAIRTE
jgi:hypothetical protein